MTTTTSLDTFTALLEQTEGPTLDFKRDPYSADLEGRAALIKDVISMANTPRTGPAYIVLGVKAHSDGTKELVGLPTSIDDNEYQNAIKPKVHPCPSFLYVPIQFDGKAYGLLVISVERKGPFQAIEDVGKKLRRYVIYWRRGSQNDEARVDEQEIIRRWCTGEVHKPIEVPLSPTTPWEKVLSCAHYFEKNRLYMLLSGPTAPETTSHLAGLAWAPWNFVIDFDSSSGDSGLASVLRPDLCNRTALRELTLGDRPTLRADGTCYWYYARGIASRVSTLTGVAWADWKRKYGLDMVDQLTRVAQYRSSRPVSIIAIWDSEDYIDTVFSSALDLFGDSVDFTVAHPNAQHLSRLAERFGSELVSIDLTHFSEALRARFTDDIARDANSTQLPTKSGTLATISAEDSRYLEEELELVGINAGTVTDDDRETCVAFSRGKSITWFELGLHCDIDRDKTSRIMKTVVQDLGGGDGRSKGTTRINLYHAPGAGGTTVARRIAWDAHTTFPTVVLKQCIPAETASRIELIYKITGLPILLLVEGADVQEKQTEDLHSILRARQVSVVFLQVLRRFSRPEERERSFFIDSNLSNVEAARFAHRLADIKPQKRSRLLALASSGAVDERTAFYFGLETFEEDFEGLTEYVRIRLAQTTPDQQVILVFLAIAYHYAQQGVPSQAFAEVLGIPGTRKVDLAQALPDYLNDLLRHGKTDLWRPAHDLIALEILRQRLAPNSQDNRVWRQNLSTWALKFADFCRGQDPVSSANMIELASRCFVLRDGRDPLGRETTDSSDMGDFSQLLKDIPSTEGRLSVLLRLTELFPSEAHFWGHLGRFYSLQMRDSVSALLALDQAILLSPDDDVLYHMKGMAIRSQLYDAMQEPVGSRQTLQNAIKIAREAAEQFAIARSKEPNDEHGFISHIQMLLRLLEYARRIVKAQSAQEVLVSATSDPALRESLDLAEELLDQARRIREGDKPSFHVERCRVQLDALYGDFEVVLRGWNNLLTRQDVYRPPIRRQLVQAYVVRRNRRWDNLDPKENSRIIELLDQNLLEEPNDKRNLRLWMQAVRRAQPPLAMDQVIEKVSYWKANSTEIDPVYYLYILFALKLLDGYVLATEGFKENVEECRRRARLRPNRTGSFEWLGPGVGLGHLVHYTELGGWSTDLDFWEGAAMLARSAGIILSIAGPEAGLIEVQGGVRAFFVPGKSGHLRGRDENRSVDFFLGFSYDGPRAWEVRSA